VTEPGRAALVLLAAYGYWSATAGRRLIPEEAADGDAGRKLCTVQAPTQVSIWVSITLGL
jgi:hypothetical protein